MSRRPPAVARWLIGRVVPPTFREAFVGDLDEAYRERCASVAGARSARLWYWSHLVSADLYRLRHTAAGVPLPPSRPRSPAQPVSVRSREPALLSLWYDVRIALRGLVRDKVFALTVTAVLALGIGVNVAIFSVVNGVLLEPLRYEDADRVVAVWGKRTGENIERTPLTAWDVVHLRENATTLTDVAAFFQQSSTLSGSTGAREVGFGWMTANTLSVMQVQPVIGRGFTEADRGELVALLDYGLWQEEFGGDPDILGKEFRLAQQTWTVIGVLPPGGHIELPSRGRVPMKTDVWAIMWVLPTNPNATNGWMRVVARMAPEVTVAQVEQELASLAATARRELPERAEYGFQLAASPLLDDFTGEAATTLRFLTVAALLVFGLVAANVANLMLLRATTRRHTMAVRVVLGASRGRVARLVLIEGVALTAAGVVAGLALGLAGLQLLGAAIPPNLPRLENVGLDGIVLAFSGALALGAVVVSGLVPALGTARSDLEGTLRMHQSAMSRRLVTRGLVIAEVAASITLLIGAGLLLRTMREVARVDPGFRAENVLTFRIAVPNQGRTTEEMGRLLMDFQERVGALPGVSAVGAVQALPLSGALATGSYGRDVDATADGDGGPQADYRFATPGYLDAMGGRLVTGRFHRPGDPATAVVVDDVMARTLWPGEDPIGRRVFADPTFQGASEFEVIGVVGHLRHETLRAGGRPTIFFSGERHIRLYLTAAVRAATPASLVSPIRGILTDLDPEMPMARIRTMDEWLVRASATTRWSLWLMTLFAVVAVAVSAVGLYGVLGQFVTGHTREIGIRLALGARRGAVARLVLRHGLTMVAVGTGVGLATASALTRLIESQLFGVSPLDPISYGAGAVAVLVAALIACALPTRRAIGVEPTTALRAE